uniref:Uncharacterized protein n=1 Tax=Neolamprologus brichardi TaxID=32507 RepID=A0A3Q4M5H6_NEOBR
MKQSVCTLIYPYMPNLYLVYFCKGVIVTTLQVVFHYKLSFRSCTDQDTWSCVSGNCGTESVELSIVDEEDKEWCQREGVMTREVSSNAVFQLRFICSTAGNGGLPKKDCHHQ